MQMVRPNEGEEGRPGDGGEVDGSTLDVISPTLVHIPLTAAPTERLDARFVFIFAQTKRTRTHKKITRLSKIKTVK